MENRDEERYPMTDIDQIANGTSLLLLKALLPYFPIENPMQFAFLIKGMEIQNLRTYYQRQPSKDFVSMEVPSPSLTDIFQTVLPFFPKEQREMLEQFKNVMEMMEMFETMQDFSEGDATYEQSESESDGSESEPAGGLDAGQPS